MSIMSCYNRGIILILYVCFVPYPLVSVVFGSQFNVTQTLCTDHHEASARIVYGRYGVQDVSRTPGIQHEELQQAQSIKHHQSKMMQSFSILRLDAYDSRDYRLLVKNVTAGSVLNLKELGLSNPSDLNFIAIPSSGTKAVVFDLNEKVNPNETLNADRMEPFVMCQNNNAALSPCTSLKIGKNVIRMTPYGSVLLTGSSGAELQIPFTIINNDPDDTHYVKPLSTKVPLRPLSSTRALGTADDTEVFSTIRINCGNYTDTFIDSLANPWYPDRYFNGGTGTGRPLVSIIDTPDDVLFQHYRSGRAFSYRIPVRPTVGTKYEVNLYFSEVMYKKRNRRVFNMFVEKEKMFDIDILRLGAPNSIVRFQIFPIVNDGFLDIKFSKSYNRTFRGLPFVSAIEVKDFIDHIAHAVASGPYSGTITNEKMNKTLVRLDGETSHTHGENLSLTSVTWKEGSVVLGTKLVTNYNFTPGEHTIALTVKDSGGFVDTEVTTVDIKPYGYPAITKITPNTCNLAGNARVTIKGSGFTFPTNETTVQFGLTNLTGGQITVVDANTMIVKCPPSEFAQPIDVRVVTPLAESGKFKFSYIDTVSIKFRVGLLQTYKEPTTGEFGPDKKLYVGTRGGKLLKMTLNSDFTKVIDTIAIIGCLDGDLSMAIMGLTFDPMDTKENPDVYFTCGRLFHGGILSSSGTTINGKIRMASGPNMETLIDLITGLAISDRDHGLNQIVFGDEGELYFTHGGLTNGGVPGRMSGSRLLKENFFTASINVAYISHPDFDGNIKYTAPDDGDPIVKGVDIFAPGSRHALSIVLHSNGKLYATDNGPNVGFGRLSTGCGPNDSIFEIHGDDKIIHVQKGKYYGSPNKKRAAYFNDPRQCVWENPTSRDTKGGTFTPAIMNMDSSSNGLFEFHSNHFNGQLRYNLIFSRFKGTLGISRAILNEDGTGMVSTSQEKIPMYIGNGGLRLTQAPNGNIIEIHYVGNRILFYEPVDASTTQIVVKTVFPKRGPEIGGNTLSIYGVNMKSQTNSTPTVIVGDKICPVLLVDKTLIDCKLPGGIGTVNITVSYGSKLTSTFENGYRYISGLLPADFILPEYK